MKAAPLVDLRKFAFLAVLVAGSTVVARAQHDVNGTAAQDTTAEAQAGPADADTGRSAPKGWSLSTGGSVMEFFDTNPLMTSAASSDNGEQFIGRVDVNNIGAKTSYVASYVPAYFHYRHFSRLNNFSQRFSQNLHHAFSKKDSLNWGLSAQEYSPWGNSDGLTLSMLGLTQLDLISKVSTAGTTLGFNHVIDRRSSVNFSLAAGVYHYGRSERSPFAALLARPDSNTWTGSAGVSYDFRIDKNRSVGVGAGHTYMVDTFSGDHQSEDSLQFRYSQQFPRHWGITVAVGPSWIEGANRGPSFELSFGASHASKRGTFQAEIQHTLAPGLEPGLTGSWALRSYYNFALSQRWVAGAYGAYQQSTGTSSRTAVNPSSAHIYMAGGQLGYRLRPHVTWYANYGYSLQSLAVTNYVLMPRQQISTGISFELNGLLRQ